MSSAKTVLLLMTSLVVLAAPCVAVPIVTVSAGSLFLVADFANTAYDVVIPGPGAVLDVGPPTLDQLFATDTGSDTFQISNIALTEATQITLNYATVALSVGQLTVDGFGIPLTAITNLALSTTAQPLHFTFDLISFDAATSVGIYTLNNFETVVGSAVPEPVSASLVGFALLSIVALKTRRK